MQSTLRSATDIEMLVLSSRLKFGERAFSIAAPRAWNSLPADTRYGEHCHFRKKTEDVIIFAKFINSLLNFNFVVL